MLLVEMMDVTVSVLELRASVTAVSKLAESTRISFAVVLGQFIIELFRLLSTSRLTAGGGEGVTSSMGTPAFVRKL